MKSARSVLTSRSMLPGNQHGLDACHGLFDVANIREESDELWGLGKDVKIANLGHRRDRCSRLVF